MLLFFIAQMTAWADSCKSKNLNTQEMNYTIYMCNHGFEKEVEIAKKWWNSKGNNITVDKGIYDCKDIEPDYGEIFIEFNDKKTKVKDIEGYYAGGVTVRNHENILDTVESSKIYLSTQTQKDRNELQIFIVHEMGHAIGYQHVSENCNNYIMNPYYENMGNKF